MKRTLILVASFVMLVPSLAIAVTFPPVDSILVDGVYRKMRVYVPEQKGKLPLVFVFHGRKGTMERAVERFTFHETWPEALVVYPQGLWVDTPGKVGPGFGWVRPDKDGNSRDLVFFDALLASLRSRFDIDPDRIYVFGQSNGAGMTYWLWAFRPEVFAAVAPANSNVGKGGYMRDRLTPKPCFMVGGAEDPIVNFDNTYATYEYLLVLNGCGRKEKKLAENCVSREGKNDCELVTYFHPGGHRYPAICNELITEFFKRHRRK